MANLLSHSESKRLYSWWWDSRIRTQNSKWLKENLTDMDSKIKSMIKIIEEDADSFAKRAEMYYRRRPELMSLVEEIYRAYRALAERYDHATGALRQAHRTMAQAFPDLNLDDVDDDDEDYCEGDVGDDVMGGELPPLVELQKRIKEYEALQEEISRLSQENDSLKKAAKSENEFEISSLKETISKLETEKEAALLQSKETSERLTNLTAQISITQEQFDKLKQEMQFKLQGFSSAQERCEELERKNKDLGLQIEKINITLQSEQIQKMSLEKKLKGWSKIEREMERIKEEKRKTEGQNRVCNSVISRLEDDLKKGGERNHSLSLELERIKQRKKEYEEEIKKGGERFVELERINQSLNLELERIKQSKKDYEDKYTEMERTNQGLSFQLERVKERERDCEEELKVEIERLNISLQESQLQKMNVEMAKMSLEKAFGESREKIRVLSEERERLQEKIRVLSEERERLEFKMERTNQSLGLELERLKQGQKEFEERESVKIEVEREMERIKGENETLVLKLKERETELNDVKTKAETERIELEREMERVKEEHDNLCFSLRERETKLSEKIGKLEKISVNLQEAHFEKMQAQISHLSIEKNLVEMQERLNLFSLQKEKLEREIDKIREENKKLDEQNHSANSKIILLQDEIIASKDVQRKLEDQVSLHAEEKRIMQEELSRIRGDKSDSEWRHFSLTEQIQNVNSNVESLQVFIKELKEGNFELREIIKNHEDIKILHYENFKQLEGLSEKNTVLENSLVVANAELEGLRRENSELEISSEKFEMERTVMVSQIEVMSENIEKLVTKKILLENSLFDANAEIEGLRERFRELDEFCRNLRGQNEKLHTDKRSLLSEVQEISCKLTNLEKRYRELELNHSNLYEEKTQILNQILNLQNMLNQERNTHFETLNLLKSETRVTKETLESEQKRVVIAQNEIFKLERSLNEANEKISKLNSIQKEKEKLSRGIISIKECLKLDKKYDSLQNVKEEILVQLILHEIKLLLSSISESQDERQNQVVEKSLVVTLLEHFGKEVGELRLERSDLKQENEIKSKELQELKGELEFILGQVSDLQDSRRSLQKEIVNLFEENSSLSDKLKDKEGSEEDFNMIITELMSKEILGVVFETLFEERVEENQKLRNEITDLRIRESDLAMCDEEIDKLLGNIKHAIFNAALFKEKVLELVITCESFEISDMVQKEVFKEEIVRRNSYVNELKEKLSKIEVENRRLKVDLNGEFTILCSLQDEVRALEEQTLALAKDNRLRANRHKNEERKVSPSKNSKARPKPTKEEANQTLNPNSELQKLHSTIKSLQKVVRETSMVLDQEHLDFTSTLCDAKKQVEILKLTENSDDDVAQVNRVNQKDIQLDLVQRSNSSSPSFSSQNSRRERVLRGGRERQKNVRASGASGNSEMWGFVEGGERESGERKNVRGSGASGNSEMWGFVEGGERESSERKKQNVRSLMMHDIELEYPEIELLERERDVKGKRPSTDQMSEKELGVDNQVVPIKVGTNESYQEWRKTVLAILSSGSQRLIALQTGLNEIKSNVEPSEGGNNNFLGQEMEGVKARIREAEGTILQLTETNNKLLKKVDDFTNNSDGDNSSNSNGNSGDLITKSQRKVLDRVTKVSEKIGRLEAEFEQVQTLILKLEEENTGRNTRNGQRRSRVLLVEYLYGKKRDSRKQRKGPACGCMRTKTQE